MNETTRQQRILRSFAFAAMLVVALTVLGCTSMRTGGTPSRYAHTYSIPPGKIFLGNDTLTLRGLPLSRARELDRYTCGSRGVMICQAVASLAQCSCYRK